MSNREELLQGGQYLIKRGHFLVKRGQFLIRFQEFWPGNLIEGQELLKTGNELLLRANGMGIDPLVSKAEINLKIKIQTTPEKGEEGFEGPPCRQSLEEKDANEVSGIKTKIEDL